LTGSCPSFRIFTTAGTGNDTCALLVPPIGILAAWTYYKQGFVDIKVAAIIAAGFVVGSLLGARFATGISNEILGKVFGAFLILVGLIMIYGK
jgi:hypothetical protein